MIRIHSLEHAANEGPGKIKLWALRRGFQINHTRMDLGEPLPSVDQFDLLVVMGGVMNVYQHRDYPWLVSEKRLISQAIAANKGILGICLGAQLLADAIGGKVFQNSDKEIGWLPVRFLHRSPPFDQFPESLICFNWHGDTFSLPDTALRVAESAACANQAFISGDRLIGLQFHAELDFAGVKGFLSGDTSELWIKAPYVQSPDYIMSNQPNLSPLDTGLEALLDGLASRLR